ncbi:hypothetical protein [Kamptonema sp. UHCC 0994]|uniref:hypothetical protein n=1 Tax=Kamptonema sp. UHCC 0994 TaxID=3031329 RepID=UPI0023B9CDCD|nr:hypothetical protein [Kamptonema sp. UHCC 0994]MDF0555618.1 hypothetical protein [Kamptonema sp. UHCC 0994]
MSAITRRPTINQVASVDLGKSMKLCGQVLQTSVQLMGKAAQLVYQSAIKATNQPEANLSQSISAQSVFQVQQNQPKIEQMVQTLAEQHGLSQLEILQVSTLVTASQLQVNSPQLLEQTLQPLMSASSLGIAQQASHNSLQQLSLAHQNVFVEHLTRACTQAAFKVGFKQLEQPPALVGNTIRLVASDDTGKSLVTEIQVDPNQPVSLATELLGTSDRSCQEILDAYDRALEEAGVRSGRPERKITGGIYELDAAREFVRRTVKPKTQDQSKASSRSQQTTRPLPQKRRLTQQQ